MGKCGVSSILPWGARGKCHLRIRQATSRPLAPKPAFEETDPKLAALDADLPGLPNDKGVFTIDEVANYLRISRTSAYELVRQRKIPTMRVGRSIRIPRRLLAAYLRGTDADAFD